MITLAPAATKTSGRVAAPIPHGSAGNNGDFIFQSFAHSLLPGNRYFYICWDNCWNMDSILEACCQNNFYFPAKT
jgi:hypothetical protein